MLALLADAPLPITQTDPALAWGALVASVLIPCLPVALGKMRDRAKDSRAPEGNSPPAGPSIDSSAAAVGASGDLLKDLVADLQRGRRDAEAKLGTAYVEIAELKAEVRTLRQKVRDLEERLMGRWGG